MTNSAKRLNFHRIKRRIVANCDWLSWRLSRQSLLPLLKASGRENIVKSMNLYEGYGVYSRLAPWQVAEELLALTELVEARQPRGVLEIGTAWGGTLFVWSRMLPNVERIISIDLPGGMFGGGYDERRVRMYQEFVSDRPNQPMVLMRCDSHLESSRDAVAAALGDTPLDFALLDGDHTYDGVRADFEMYEPLVAPGGLIAFHDIVPQEGSDVFGVARFWEEIKQKYEHRELVKDWNQGKMGIGVLFKPA